MKNSIILLLFAIYLNSCQEDIDFIKPKKRELIEAVYASGVSKPIDEFTLTAIGSGYIEKIHFEEGDTLSIGNPILKIKNNSLKSNLDAAKTALDIAKSNLSPTSPILRDLFDRKEVVIKKYELDSLNLTRYRRLYENEAISKVQLEQYEMQSIRAKADVTSTNELIDQTRDKLLIELENAKANYIALKENQTYYDLRSSTEGKIYELYKSKGELLKQGEPIALIGSADSMYVELSIDELDLNKIDAGQKVLLNIEVFSDTVFKAKIGKIYPMINKQDQTIKANCYFDEMPEGMYSGLTVEANIIINNKKSVLTIPKEYVFSRDSVLVLDGKNKIATKIEIGLESDKYVEVVSGIDKNDKIIK
jgi:RND family efflux transporter MFP subunit